MSFKQVIRVKQTLLVYPKFLEVSFHARQRLTQRGVALPTSVSSWDIVDRQDAKLVLEREGVTLVVAQEDDQLILVTAWNTHKEFAA